jgi:MYXO-CTERM domain-containing protein
MKKLARIGALAVLGAFGWTGAAAIVAAPAYACTISPGQTGCIPDTLTLDPSTATLKAQANCSPSPCTITTSPPGITATYSEKVYVDPGNTLGPCAPNCLTWLLQVSNVHTSTDVIERITISHFGGFITDVGVDTGPNYPSPFTPVGTITPTSVERSSDGNVLRWVFNGNTGEIAAGQTSAVLEVQTNSTQVTLGTVTVQNGESGTGPGVSPAVPESTWVPALSLAGLVGVAGLALRRRRRPATRG